jgi:hypothetical protein
MAQVLECQQVEVEIFKNFFFFFQKTIEEKMKFWATSLNPLIHFNPSLIFAGKVRLG